MRSKEPIIELNPNTRTRNKITSYIIDTGGVLSGHNRTWQGLGPYVFMNFVEPIRDWKKISQIKNLLRGQRRYRDLLFFVVGINTALRIGVFKVEDRAITCRWRCQIWHCAQYYWLARTGYQSLTPHFRLQQG